MPKNLVASKQGLSQGKIDVLRFRIDNPSHPLALTPERKLRHHPNNGAIFSLSGITTRRIRNTGGHALYIA